MIEFKIVTTPDKTQQLLYQIEEEELVIGNEEGEMIIDDPQIGPRQLRIFFQGEQVYVDNLDPNVEVRLNGKPVDVPTLLKERDNLTMARTQIQFLKVDHAPILPPEPFIHPQAEVRFKEGGAEKAILDALEYFVKSSGSGLANTSSAGPQNPTSAAPQALGAMPKPPTPKAPPPLPSGKPPLPPPIPKRSS